MEVVCRDFIHRQHRVVENVHQADLGEQLGLQGLEGKRLLRPEASKGNLVLLVKPEAVGQGEVEAEEGGSHMFVPRCRPGWHDAPKPVSL